MQLHSIRFYYKFWIFLEKKFLAFFFKRLKKNNTERYTKDFPYLSPCGFERNYVRCDDLPIVFTEITPGKISDENFFSCNHTGNLFMVCGGQIKFCLRNDILFTFLTSF